MTANILPYSSGYSKRWREVRVKDHLVCHALIEATYDVDRLLHYLPYSAALDHVECLAQVWYQMGKIKTDWCGLDYIDVIGSLLL